MSQSVVENVDLQFRDYQEFIEASRSRKFSFLRRSIIDSQAMDVFNTAKQLGIDHARLRQIWIAILQFEDLRKAVAPAEAEGSTTVVQHASQTELEKLVAQHPWIVKPDGIPEWLTQI